MSAYRDAGNGSNPRGQSGLEVYPTHPPVGRSHLNNLQQTNVEHWQTQKSPVKFETSLTMPESNTALNSQSTPEKKRLSFLGLSHVAFTALLCVLVAAITGAAVGGGVGARLASCQNQVKTASGLASNGQIAVTMTKTVSSVSTSADGASSPTTSVSLSAYDPPNPADVTGLNKTCITSQQQTSIYGDRYVSFCYVDFGSGSPADDGTLLMDWAALTVYSFGECLNACSGFNFMMERWKLGGRCYSVAFNFAMRDSLAKDRANCWLKSGTLVKTQPNSAGFVHSAVLVV